jgi:hypothetical protein
LNRRQRLRSMVSERNPNRETVINVGSAIDL